MEAPQTRDQDHLGAGTHPPMFALLKCHEDHAGMGSVSIISSNTSSSSPSEELELRTGAVVIDTGTRSCKAGFSGQQTSIAKINTLVGCPTAWPPGSGEDRPKAFFGEEALLYPDTEIEPMQNCIIISWEVAETLWQHLFDHKLQVPPKEYALLITEPLSAPPPTKRRWWRWRSSPWAPLASLLPTSLSFPPTPMAEPAVWWWR